MEPSKKKLLIFIDWFSPGYRGGGPVQSILNLAVALQEKLEIRIVTRDTDYGGTQSYDTVQSDRWTRHAMGFDVLYLSAGGLGYQRIKNIIEEEEPDHLYLNSMYSRFFTLYPLLVARRRHLVVTQAPRGMLYASALSKKAWKKKLYLSVVKRLYTGERIRFHATNEQEALAIRRLFGAKRIFVANNLPAQFQRPFSTQEKIAGELSCVFIARIDPIKNLLFFIGLLAKLRCKVVFTIVGPAEDAAYWVLCQQAIRKLPPSITVRFEGPAAPETIDEKLKASHLYVLLSQGENFGHSIFESFLAGRPVLISDQTPWRGLEEEGIGADVPLDDPDPAIRFLENAAAWSQEEFDAFAGRAWQFAADYLATDANKQVYLEIFN